MTGQQFQNKVCKYLSGKGFWVYETINKTSGQPVDIIAAKDDICYIIECKVTKSDRFPFSRVEDNQLTAIELFGKCGNEESYFAFGFTKHLDDIVFVEAEKILEFVESNITSITYDELCEIRTKI